MKGIIFLPGNYTYEGDIVRGEPHGFGVFKYVNGHRYTGECMLGKYDGFGVYEYDAFTRYTGYFSLGKFHGLGTYETQNIIVKGPWRDDKRHGYMTWTNKLKMQTIGQLWVKGRLIDEESIGYIQPEALVTTKQNPTGHKSRQQQGFHGTEKKCIGCMENSVNATNAACGHVCMCYDCLAKCETCPICRARIEKIIKLFVS